MHRLQQFGIWGVALWLSAVSLGGAAADAPLADAVERMDRVRIRALLQQRVDVNATQVDGMAALQWAAYHDDLETVELLVRAGANVNAQSRYGVRALSLACENGNGAIVELLLDAGADPNTTLPGGETALMTASRVGRLGPVKALLARGADVHRTVQTLGRAPYPGAVPLGARLDNPPVYPTKAEQTALIWAAAEGHAEVVEELIKAGADFRTMLESGYTPLLFAVREGRIEVVRTLLKAGADVNEVVRPQPFWQHAGFGQPIRAGTRPLHMAVANGHFELAVALLDAGADPNGADPTGYTALHAVVAARRVSLGDDIPPPAGSGNITSLEFVTKLAAHGANLNARWRSRGKPTQTGHNEVGTTAFLRASQTADVELMRILVKLGADPRLKNEDSGAALTLAGRTFGTESEVLEVMQLALDLGVDINAVDNSGDTAMHSAANLTFPKVVRFLAAKGASIETWNRQNKLGWTPLQIAAGYRRGNFNPSPETEAAVREVMIAAGVTPPERVIGKP